MCYHSHLGSDINTTSHYCQGRDGTSKRIPLTFNFYDAVGIFFEYFFVYFAFKNSKDFLTRSNRTRNRSSFLFFFTSCQICFDVQSQMWYGNFTVPQTFGNRSVFKYLLHFLRTSIRINTRLMKILNH